MLGTCLKFDRVRGFGFLLSTEDPTLPDIFFHVRDIKPSPTWNRRFLLPGFKVEFDFEFEDADETRAIAKNVRVIPPLTIARQTGGVLKTFRSNSP
jgi:cold shock CspA family protein